MCRLLIGSKGMVNAYDRSNNILSLLQHLERQCGGHGNGLALLRKGKLIHMQKGVSFTVSEAAERLRKEAYDFAIFHTRIASVGAIDDALCHPYTSENDVLAMNGTLSELKSVANAISSTDTEIAFRLVQGKNLDETTKILKALPAVFVGACNGKPYIVRSNGDLEEWSLPTTTTQQKNRRDFLFASSFPNGIRGCAIWYGGYGGSFTFADGVRKEIQKEKTASAWGDYYYYTPSSSSSSAAVYDDGIDAAYEEGFVHGFEEGYAAMLQVKGEKLK